MKKTQDQNPSHTRESGYVPKNTNPPLPTNVKPETRPTK